MLPPAELTVRALAGDSHRNAVQTSAGDLYVEANVPLDQTLTPWVPFLTPIAMSMGSSLRLEGSVAASARTATREAQRVLAGWWPDLTEVDVDAIWSPPPPPAPGVGLFFSGGVDSFYSALTRADEVTHLVFVIGFDVGARRPALLERTLREVRAAAAKLDKELIEARTNIRRLSNAYCSWGRQYHGAALAGIAHMLSPVIGSAIIPSSLSHPWGSDPELDPLWSSSVTIVHDRAASRFDMTERLVESEVALQHLRVCYQAGKTEDRTNCGQCEKCLRTMISLYALGALSRAGNFPHSLDVRAIGRLPLRAGSLVFARENLARLRQMPVRDVAVERALARAIRRAPVRAATRRLGWSIRRSTARTGRLVGRVRRRVARLLPEDAKARMRRWVRHRSG